MKNKLIDNLIKKTTVAAVIASAFTGISISGVQAEGKQFTDFNDVPEYAKTTIQKLMNDGKVNGFSDGTFKPLQKVTRAEFYSMIMSSVELPEKYDSVSFADKNMTTWQTNVMDEAVKKGLTSGTGENEFGEIYVKPGALISREEMASILVRVYEELYTYNFEFGEFEEVFKDYSKLSDWSELSVNTALMLGLINGTSSDTLNPLGNGTRTEAAIFADRLNTLISNVPTTLDVSENKTYEEILENYYDTHGIKALRLFIESTIDVDKTKPFEEVIQHYAFDGLTEEQKEAYKILYPERLEEYDGYANITFEEPNGELKTYWLNGYDYYVTEEENEYFFTTKISDKMDYFDNSVNFHSSLTFNEIENLLRKTFNISDEATSKITVDADDLLSVKYSQNDNISIFYYKGYSNLQGKVNLNLIP